MFKQIVLVGMLLLAACSQQSLQESDAEKTVLVLRAERLVGMVLELDQQSRLISASDLVPYAVNRRGIRDVEGEELETMVVPVSPGSHRVRVTRDGDVLEELTMAFRQDQARELRIIW